jgi:GTP-binding protein
MEPGRDPLSDIHAIEHELAAYDELIGLTGRQEGRLADRPRLVALNKIDVPDGRDLAEIVRPDLEERGLRVFEVSAATREGLRELAYAMAELVAAHRAAAPPPAPTRLVIRPPAVDDTGFIIEQDADGVYVVRGPRPERWVRQTNFDNDEAVGFLADRLARLGVEDALARAGAEPGSPVRIGDREFDWEPTVYAGPEYVPAIRGADTRLEERSTRSPAAERLAARKARRRRPEDEAAPGSEAPPGSEAGGEDGGEAPPAGPA